MSYFNSFKYINYNFPDNIQRQYKNLSVRLDLLDKVKNDLSSFQPYYVKENETPEIVSYNFYDTVDFHWCIMIVNNMVNLYTDWPKPTKVLDKVLLEKYRKQISQHDSEVVLSDISTNELIYFTGSPSNNYQDSDGKYGVIYRPHHFEDTDKNIYSVDTPTSEAKNAFGRLIIRPILTPVSHYSYEFDLNESKRNIVIPSSTLVRQMEIELKKLLNE